MCASISSRPADGEEAKWGPLQGPDPAHSAGDRVSGAELAFFLLQYIFADAYAQYLWITFDFCNTIQGFSIPFRAADLLLHSKASNLLLGFDRSHPNKQVRELLEPCFSGFLFLPVWVVCPLGELSPHTSSSAKLTFALVDFPCLREVSLPGRLPVPWGQCPVLRRPS